MADGLRAARRAAPDFAAAARVRFIETSPRLRAAQAAKVPGAAWHDTLDTVPDGAFLLLANEFLDALPVRQFVRRGGGWTERYVQDGAWRELPAGAPPGREAADGQVVEINEASRAFVAEVAARLARHSGAALFIDYGPLRSAPGDSLQAIAAKRMADPLGTPGSADLTAHVDFADLARVARRNGAAVQGPVTQGAFLTALGLVPRTESLARENPARAAALREAALRLADNRAMGALFKVMAVTSPGCPALPGVSRD
jgi:SAM-dependent MidA family methyltransferase